MLQHLAALAKPPAGAAREGLVEGLAEGLAEGSAEGLGQAMEQTRHPCASFWEVGLGLILTRRPPGEPFRFHTLA